MFSTIKTYNQLLLQDGWQGSTCQKHNIAENFTYDNLNRLRTYTVEQNSIIEDFEVQYYDNGNISEKSDVGQYVYDDTDQPHAVKVILPYDMEGGQYQHNPLLDQDIQYNSFNKATKITQGDYELEIFYGHDKERRKTILKEDGNTVYTRYYLGKYEKEIRGSTTTEYYYVGGPMGNIAVYISENGEAPELHYTITDHLGSIVAIADEDGEIIEEQRYDPWGVYRNPITGEPQETPQLTKLFRGYTGHEMLPEFGLINMNGRLYDPVIARVLSPDNYVQNPYNPQNYNRYSYCYNNPLVYVDPDGEFIITAAVITGALIGAYIGGSIANEGELNPRAWNWKWGEGTYKGMLIGGAVGAFAGYTLACFATQTLAFGFMSPSVSLTTPIGTVGMAASPGIGYEYQWTTVAGGGGGGVITDRERRDPTRIKTPTPPNWDGPYYQGTENEVRKLLLETSIMANVETLAYFTERGWYFEKLSGTAYGYTSNIISGEFLDYNVPLYSENSINGSHIYSEFYRPDGLSLYSSNYITPENVFYRSRVVMFVHTHPNNTPPNDVDREFSRIFGIPGTVYGWNGSIFRFNAFYY